jgi:hypothetical protein
VFDWIFRARRGGAFLIIVGLIVTTAGAVFVWQLIDLPSGPHRAGMAAVTFGFLVFGTASIVQGVLQLRGRQSKALLRIMVVIAVAFAAVEIIASLLL